MKSPHTFHIPVMGLAYTVDTPVKVARFGITSVVSVIQDRLIEKMREFYCRINNENYVPIPLFSENYRARRIMEYLNLLHRIVSKQMDDLRKMSFDEENDLVKYFRLLPESSPLKLQYLKMRESEGNEQRLMQEQLRKGLVAGDIDVNIMTKIDKPGVTKAGELLAPEFSDASSALRGFATSTLSSSVVLSAGMNPKLFSYMAHFHDFFPTENGVPRKKIILKVSDYRSAFVQGKILAKKGLWVSEFRIESGLNCGGHTFPTEGMLMGPILEEFKNKQEELLQELLLICNTALHEKELPLLATGTRIRITVQGGIGTAKEDLFLREYYKLNGTGWGSPFLLVPEAVNIDEVTLKDLTEAKKEDYFLSNASPLGVPFNNFRKSGAEKQRKERIANNRAGSPCFNKYLAFNTEFTKTPLCTASRKYQFLKLKEIDKLDLSAEERRQKINEVTEKDCLCEGLSTTAFLKNKIKNPHYLNAVTICPGPNLAYFSKVSTLEEMTAHIYGKTNLLNTTERPHVFVNELMMYVDYLKEEVQKNIHHINKKQLKYFSSFKANLQEGIEYYKALTEKLKLESIDFKKNMLIQLEEIQHFLFQFSIPLVVPA